MAIYQASDKDFKDQLNTNSKVMVKFFADWCGSCKLFSPKFKRIVTDENNSTVTFIMVNAEENPEARKMAGVDNLPFFATFKGGALVEGAATSKEEYVLQMIENLKK